MPSNLFVLLVATGLALWAVVAFAAKAWELFASGKAYFAVMAAGVAVFAGYLAQGYVRLVLGILLRRATADAARRPPAATGDAGEPTSEDKPPARD